MVFFGILGVLTGLASAPVFKDILEYMLYIPRISRVVDLGDQPGQELNAILLVRGTGIPEFAALLP